MATESEHTHLTVRLTPGQAKQIARSIRIELATRIDGNWQVPLPSRAEVAELRALIEACSEELDQIAWGDPDGDVEMHCARERFEDIARDMNEGGETRVTTPGFWDSKPAAAVREEGR